MMLLKFNEISSSLSTERALPLFQQFLFTMMKLHLNLPFKYLSYIFGVSPSTSSDIFYSCIDIFYEKFHKMVYWPDRETIKKTMSDCFKKNFKDNVVVIINCFEIFIENPLGLVNAA